MARLLALLGVISMLVVVGFTALFAWPLQFGGGYLVLSLFLSATVGAGAAAEIWNRSAVVFGAGGGSTAAALILIYLRAYPNTLKVLSVQAEIS